MLDTKVLFLLPLTVLVPFSVAQANYPCGNGTNSTTTVFTTPSAIQAAFTNSLGYPCSSYTGNIVIIPTTNYDLEDYGSIIGAFAALNGSLLINCTGVSTNVVPGTGEGDYSAFSTLTTVTGSIGIIGCSSVYLLDWYGLTTIGGNLTIMDNPSLQEVLIYELQSINGSINIQMITPDPYDSNSIDLTALKRVGGDFNITGPLISLSENPAGVPNLTDVQGSVFINSTAKLDCTPWTDLNSSGVVKGDFFCASTLPLAGSSSVHLSKGTIIGISVGSVVAVLLGIIGCFVAKRKVDSHSASFWGGLAGKRKKNDSDLPGPAELFGKGNIPEIGESSGQVRRAVEVQQAEPANRLSEIAIGQQGGNELEGDFVTRASYAPAELSGWDRYEMPTGAERHEM